MQAYAQPHRGDVRKQAETMVDLYADRVLLVVVLLGWSSSAIKFKGLAAKGSEVAYGIVYGIVHPDTNLLLNLTEDGVPFLLLETVAIAVLGTLIGGLLAVPFSFLASENIVPKWVAFIVRALILLIRTIPSLVWALVWIRVTGPGPFCGVVTQSICSIGMISKMYINAIRGPGHQNPGKPGRRRMHHLPENPLRHPAAAVRQLHLHASSTASTSTSRTRRRWASWARAASARR